MGFIAAIVSAVSAWWGATAIGSFLASIGITGSMLLTAGINVAATLIQNALAKQSTPPGGVKFDRQYGADVPRQVACGVVAIAGHDCYVNTYAKSNKSLQQVFALSDYYCDGFNRVAINGKWQTLGGVADPDKGFPVTSGDFANLIWIKFVDGTQVIANANLVAKAHPSDRWDDDYVGVGIAHIIVSMAYDQEDNNSFPDFFFEFRGARLYDWRKDSTVGGSGSHRWGDYSTHEFTRNPTVIEYNYRRGLSVNGDLFCGMEMPASDLPLDKWTAAANICDETVSAEPRYQVSILLDCMRSHGDNIESIMLACGGMTVDAVDGSWPLVGSDQPIVATITDDDFITGAPFQFQAKRSMSELVNSVSGNSPDPEQLWSMVGYDPQISAAALAVDRRTRDLNIDFPMVPSMRQAGQLASIYLKENRYEATASGMLRPRWQVLEAGDWIRWNSVKYGDLTYIMTESSLASLESDGPRNAQVTLQQRDGSIYDGVTPPIVVVPVPAGEPDYATEPEGFLAAGIQIQVAGSSERKPAIRFTWNAFDDVTVTGVEVEYRPVGQTDSIINHGDTPVQALVVSDGVLADTEYEYRRRILTDPQRTTFFTAWDTVTTPPAVIADISVGLTQLQQDVYQQLQALQTDIAAAYDRLAQIAASAIDAAGRTAQDNSTSRRFRDATASTLRSQSSSIEETQAGLVAQAEILDAVQATVGDTEAGILWRMRTVAGVGDVVAQVVLEVRASVSDVWVAATTLWQAGFVGGDPLQPFSKFVVVADQTIFTDGVDGGTPIVIEDGQLKLQVANIGTVIAGLLTGPTGAMKIDLNAEFISASVPS